MTKVVSLRSAGSRRGSVSFRRWVGLLAGGLWLLAGCGATPEDGEAWDENTGIVQEGLRTAGSGWVRTPAVRGPSAYQTLSCMNCQGNSDLTKRNSWRSTGTGIYYVRFPGLAPASGTKVAVQVSALGDRGVVCHPTGTGPTGDDYIVTVYCKKNGVNVDSRFTAAVTLKTNTQTGPDQGFARVLSNAIRNDFSWTSDGQLPTLSRSATGVYTVTFPGLKNTSTGGNAQVSSLTAGVNCSLTNWSTSSSTGTRVGVACYTTANAASDANIYVTYTQLGGWGGTNSGFIWANQPSTTTLYTPSTTYNRALSGNGYLTVLRTSVGEYTVYFNTTSNNTNLIPLLSTWGSAAECVVTEADQRGIRVSCSDSGNPVDAYFSLFVASEPAHWASGMKQVPVTGTNFKSSSFDAGRGLICGVGAAGAFSNQVLCVVPASVATPSDVRIACGGAVPGGVKSVAIDNVYAGPTRILALGTDNVLRTCSGDLRNAWGSGSNFTTWTEVAPALNESGAAVALKKVVVVRSSGYSGTDVFGLSTAGALLGVKSTTSGNRWGVPNYYLWPAGTTFKDISHGTYDLYLLTSANAMVVSRRNGGYGGIPALPNGLLPIAMGGPFVTSNAGLTNGKYPCTGPANSSGYYTCAGNDQRFFRFMSDRTWVTVTFPPFPTENDADVLTSGQPFASVSPTIVDAEAFEGNANAFLAWQYFSRLYQLID